MVQQFMLTSGPPYDFAAHYDTLAPEAMVLIGAMALPRTDIDRATYAKSMRDFMRTAGLTELGPAFSLERHVDWRPDDEGGTLLANIRELKTKTSLSAAFRLVPDGETWQVRSACLQNKPLPPADVVIARSLAEFAYWRPTSNHDEWPMHGLGLAYIRRHVASHEPLLSLPEARFTCQGSGFCCAQIGNWDVGVHSNTRKAVNAMPWSGLGMPGPTFIPPPGTKQTDVGPSLIAGCGEGGCASHVDGRCTLHQSVGWQPIEPCLVFPYQFMATPDGIAVTCSFICHSVGDNKGSLLQEQQADVRLRLQAVRSLVTEVQPWVPLLKNGPVLTWEAYRRIETLLLGILADTTLGPMPDRLLRGHEIMIGLLTVFRFAKEIDLAAIEHVLATPLPDLARMPSRYADEWMGLMLKPSADPAGFKTDRIFGDWHRQGWTTGEGKPLGDALDDELITRYLRTVLYRKLGLAGVGLAFLWSTVTWAARAWEREARFMSSQREDAPIDRALQLDVARHIDTLFLSTPFLREMALHIKAHERFVNPRTWLSLSTP